MFTASTREALETLELRISYKIVNVVVDSGASCNLMSDHVFHFLTGGEVPLAGCDKKCVCIHISCEVTPG